MNLNAEDVQAIALTLQLASVTTVLLLLLATPVAWWLAHTRSAWRAAVASLVALPLVLPPTVLGFYLLVALGPNGPIGQFTQWAGWGTLAFSFWGLVLGSVIYSLPFAVQPLVNAFEPLQRRLHNVCVHAVIWILIKRTHNFFGRQQLNMRLPRQHAFHKISLQPTEQRRHEHNDTYTNRDAANDEACLNTALSQKTKRDKPFKRHPVRNRLCTVGRQCSVTHFVTD